MAVAVPSVYTDPKFLRDHAQLVKTLLSRTTRETAVFGAEAGHLNEVEQA
jgi:hypothetical protein